MKDMKPRAATRPARRSRVRFLTAALLGATLLLHGCGGSGGSNAGGSSPGPGANQGFTIGGGAGGSVGPAGATYATGTNGGATATPGGHGSIVITLR